MSNSHLDFTGKVAIVCGGGRGMGAAYSRLLASRGAAVVVNDSGVQPGGEDPDASVAANVVKEIEAEGGRALASVDSVATSEGGQAIVDAALETFGQVDLLVNNAGLLRFGHFTELSMQDVMDTLSVHLLSAWYVGQPVWRNMEERGTGRIVLTTSIAQFGHPTNAAYAAAKGGITAMVKSLAQEARDRGLDIKINAVSPVSAGRNAREETLETWGDLIDPGNVAAVVGYLLSDECPVNGEIIEAGGTYFARTFFGQTRGWKSGKSPLTPEQVREHFAEAFDMEGYVTPTDNANALDIRKQAVFGSGRS